MNRKLSLMLTILLSIVLTACAGTSKDTAPNIEPDSKAPNRGAAVDTNANNAFGTGMSASELERLGIFGDPRNERVVYFEYNSTSVDRRSQVILGAHAAHLSQRSGARVSLEGHADERGTRDYNLALGERRANVVADVLNAKGANSKNQTISYGEERPVDTAHTEGSWQKNRRVEIKY